MDSLLPIHDFVHIALFFLFLLASSLLFKNRPKISAAATASSSDESILFVYVLLVPVCVMCVTVAGTSCEQQLSTGTSHWCQKPVSVTAALVMSAGRLFHKVGAANLGATHCCLHVSAIVLLTLRLYLSAGANAVLMRTSLKSEHFTPDILGHQNRWNQSLSVQATSWYSLSTQKSNLLPPRRSPLVTTVQPAGL